MNKLSMSGLYTLTEWITRFAYVNLLWIGFSLLGLVVFGISPATVAMFTIIRKWIMGDNDFPVFQTFWNSYKKEFLRGNRLGLVIALLAYIIFIDLNYIKLDTIIQIPLYLIIFAIVMTILYIFPVYVHYNVTFIQLFKNSFFIMMVNPLSSILMLIGFVALFFVMKFLPALSFFFGGSLSAGIIMSSCYLAFQKIEKKLQKATSA
ncbi:YesL family protein [Neobacillus sp. 179-C4.2 HS]|uniref:YesL family protein n=1 Tax=Neobacillus driksii TaxID=3035913 RepID=A0ABV4Z256_9BACI|nr:YesL family protein [Neobacillus sp. 179.-C4.2 HS]MDP5197665.1 YesL family protein [Neobacillus sp. 179.-C4.2 HS]